MKFEHLQGIEYEILWSKITPGLNNEHHWNCIVAITVQNNLEPEWTSNGGHDQIEVYYLLIFISESQEG